jgi:protein-disulfide isomerase
MIPIMRITIIPLLLLSLSLAACEAAPVQESFRQKNTQAVSGSGLVIEDLGNETMPKTTDSLEVQENREPLLITAITGSVLIGRNDVPILTVWMDDDCEYCRQFTLNHLPILKEEFVRSGKMAIALFFLPKSDAGRLMAKITLCSLQFEKFEEVQKELSLRPISTQKDLPAFSKRVNIDTKKLAACVDDKRIDDDLARGMDDAKRQGITRVPFFRINDQEWLGLKEVDALHKIIIDALK